MHIPAETLIGAVCPVTIAVSAVSIASAAFIASRHLKNPSKFQLAIVSSFVFVLQMINFPIQNGTSGHFIGSILCVYLFGVPWGILTMSSVITIQTLFFADGGIIELGANILNMALMGPAVFFTISLLSKKLKYNISKPEMIVFISWLSISLSALVCSLQLYASGIGPFLGITLPMLSIHLAGGIIEGGITTLCIFLFNEFFSQENPRLNILGPLATTLMIALLITPLSSNLPDSLNWLLNKYYFVKTNAPYFIPPFADYKLGIISDKRLSIVLASLAGVSLTFGFTLLTYYFSHFLNYFLNSKPVRLNKI